MEIQEVQHFVFAGEHPKFATWPETYVQYSILGQRFLVALMADMGAADNESALDELSKHHPSRQVSVRLEREFTPFRDFIRRELFGDHLPGDVETNMEEAVKVAQKANLLGELIEAHCGLMGASVPKGVH